MWTSSPGLIGSAIGKAAKQRSYDLFYVFRHGYVSAGGDLGVRVNVVGVGCVSPEICFGGAKVCPW